MKKNPEIRGNISDGNDCEQKDKKLKQSFAVDPYKPKTYSFEEFKRIFRNGINT